MTPRFAIIAILTLWPSLVFAQDFSIKAKDVSGQATLGSSSSFNLSYQSFGKAKSTVKLSGKLTWNRQKSAFQLRYKVPEKERTGLAKTLQNLFARFQKKTVKYESVIFKKANSGRFTGELQGHAMTFSPRSELEKSLMVLVIPGLSTNNWNKFGVPYLDENVAALKARGLQARRLEISTEESVAVNARYIANEIKKEAAAGRRVVIFAHSKGGTDTTAALALYPDLIKHVAGVVAVQPVYGGSPVADLVQAQSVLRGSMALVFEQVFKGSRDAVLDLTRARRSAFVAKHPYPASKVPTVVIRSTFDRRFSRSILWANQKMIKNFLGLGSDGMVLLADQNIPGAVKTLTYQDLDHFEPGVRVESPHTPADLTNAAFDSLKPFLKAQNAVAWSRPRVNLPLGEDE
ncbi:MAG: hypothetical protein P1V97_03000 [Planctomycetota bacterium]|nr:hypothetical protein [Planctomycetota bacterium]